MAWTVLDFDALQTLTATEMDQLYANVAGLKDGTLFDAGVIGTTDIADDAVTADKVDWASTGAGGGIWWEELGRTTLGSAGDTISVTSIPDRMYLRVIVKVFATGGTVSLLAQYNADTGTNYSTQYDNNFGGSPSSSTSSDSVRLRGANTSDKFAIIDILNEPSIERLSFHKEVEDGGAGEANYPLIEQGVGKWDNTSDTIDQIDIVNSGTGSFDTGSEVVVLGHN